MADDPKTPKTMTFNLSKGWEWTKDALAIAVFPLVGWVINLSVQNAVRDEHIKSLQEEVVDLRTKNEAKDAALASVKDQFDQNVKEVRGKIDTDVGGVKERVNDVTIQMVRLEGKIDAANLRLEEVKVLLAVTATPHP